ncbi:MAG: SAM-dependent methyltransferase [Chitinophagales bacterium]
MDELNKDFWTERYQNQQIGWDIGHVSPALEKYFLQLNDKNISILIPGAGNSYEAEYLHKNGFNNATIIDWAASPIEDFKSRNPSFPEEKCLQVDFFEVEGKYDLIIEQTFFCALPPARREDYVRKMNSLLTSSGKLVGVLFNRDFEGGPPFGGSKREYLPLFSPYFEVSILEKCYNSIPSRAGTELFMIMKNK